MNRFDDAAGFVPRTTISREQYHQSDPSREEGRRQAAHLGGPARQVLP